MSIKNLIKKNKGLTLVEMLIALAVFIILLGIIFPSFTPFTEDVENTVSTINEKIFKTNESYDNLISKKPKIRIGETADLTTLGDITSVEAVYNGTFDLKLLVNTNKDDSWYSNYDNSWTAINYTDEDEILEKGVSIIDFNNINLTEWLDLLENAEEATFGFYATNNEGEDVTWEVDLENISIIITGTNGSETISFSNDENAKTAQKSISLPDDSSNLFADNKHRDNGDSINNYDLVNADTSNTTNMNNLFNNSDEFNENLSGWDFSNTTDIDNMVNDSGIEQGNYNDLVEVIVRTNSRGWTIDNVVNSIGNPISDISYSGEESITPNPLSFPNDSSNLFAYNIHRDNSDSVNNYNLANVNTANIENMSGMFDLADEFNQNISNWNTGNVTNMENLFYGASQFNQNLGGWDFSRVNNINNMVQDSGLNQNNFNNLVDAIYNTNDNEWSMPEILNSIGTPNTGVEYTGSIGYVQLSHSDIKFGSISGGGAYSVGIRSNSTLVHWGFSLGDPTPSGYFKQVDAGGSHAVGLKTNGSIVSWGNNTHDQITDTPTGTNFSQVAAGEGYFSVALKTDGSVVSWGDNEDWQVFYTPTEKDFVQVDAGSNFGVALKEDGSIVAWGDRNGEMVTDAPSGNDFVQVAAGNSFALALKQDGSIIGWGYDGWGQLSDIPSGNGFIQIDAGASNAIALKSDGSIISWDRDDHDQVRDTPTGNDFVQVDTAGFHSLALRSDGTLEVWGRDNYNAVSGTPSTTFKTY